MHSTTVEARLIISTTKRSSMPSDPKLITYDVKCPNRTALQWMRSIGWITNLAGITLGVLAICRFFSALSGSVYDYNKDMEYYARCVKDRDYAQSASQNFVSSGLEPKGYYYWNSDSYSCTVPHQPWLNHFVWYYPLIVLVVGIILTSWASERYRTYFTRVRQGKIIKKDICGGGGGGMYSYGTPISHEVLVEGYTYSNELYRQWKCINAGEWFERFQVGDYIDFR